MAGLLGETVNVRVYFTGTTRIVNAMGSGTTDTEVYNGSVVVGNGVEVPSTFFTYTPQSDGGGNITASGNITVDLTDTGYTITFAGTAQPYGLTFVFSSLAGESIGTVTAAAQTAANPRQGVNGTRVPTVDDQSVVTSGFNLFGYQTDTNISQTVSLTFTERTQPANTAPIAVNDTYSTNEGVLLSVPSRGILSNDTDAENASLSAALVTGPQHGTLSLASNGGFTYQPNSNYFGSDSFSYKANDGSLDSGLATVTINVSAVNDAPTLSGAANRVSYIENASGIVVASALTVGDVDSASLASATVRISAGRVFGDTLNFVAQNGITGSFNAASGTLTLTGSASVANFQAALRSVTFSSSSEDPTSGDRTVEFTVTDGADGSNTATSTVAVTGVNDAPTIAALATLAATEQVALNLKGSTTIADVDAGNGVVRTALTVGYGVLTAAAGNSGVTIVSGNNSGALVIDGSVAATNAFLGSVSTSTLTYTANTATPPATATLNVSVNDNGNTGGASLTGTGSTTINITAVNDTPTAKPDARFVIEDATISTNSRTLGFLENDTDPDTGDAAALTIVSARAGTSAADSFAVPASGTSEIVGTYGKLNLAANGTYSYAAISAAAQALAANANATDTFTYTASDPGGLTSSAQVTIIVTGTNDAPVIDLNGAAADVDNTAAYTERAPRVALASGLTVSDVDNGAIVRGATVRITGGLIVGADQLSVAGSTSGVLVGVTYSYDAVTGTLALTGDATQAQYQSVLNQVAFASTSSNPGASRTVSWTVNDGTLNSSTATTTVDVTSINDAPTIDLDGTGTAGIDNTATFFELGTAATLAPNLVLSDVDGGTLRSATVTLIGAQAGDVLSYTNDGGLNAITVTTSDTITLTFSSAAGASLSTYEAALRTVTFSSTSSEPGTARSIYWSVNDGQAANAVSALATTTLQITSFAIEQAAVVTANEGNETGGTLTFTVTRTGDISESQTLSVRSIGGDSNGKATVDNDFTVPATITFAAGSATAMVEVAITPDRTVEADETVMIGLFRDETAATAVATATGTIVNDDDAGSFSIANLTVNEGTGDLRTYTFTVTRSGGSGDAVVGVTALDGGNTPGSVAATQGQDYQLLTPTLIFADGANTATGKFTVTGDNAPEANEQFRLQLMSGTSGATFARNTAVVTIVDNDNSGGTGGGAPTPTPTPTPEPTPTPGLVRGTDSNDVLISTNTGNSTLSGGAGNDTYLVYSLGDVVLDGVNGGTDILYTTVSYNLGENQIEAMSVADQMTTNPINLIGNFVSQTIVGNYGNNVLNGGGGKDTLIGLFGDDTYAVGDSRILVQEQGGQGFDTLVTSVDYRLGAGVSIEVFAAQDASSTTGLRLTGNELAQTIAGTAGADTLSGGGGRDVLIGGAGADTFVIGTVATGNVAVLADFAAGTDRIGLTSTAFNVGTTLDGAEFVTGTAAATADQRVIYDAGTGQLFYDADGNGAGAAILFAQVVLGTAITAASFDVIVPTATAG